MKKILSLTLLAVLASSASAASSQSDVMQLPNYVVDAPPHNAAIRAIYKGLQAMQAQPTTPKIEIDLPALKTQVTVAQASRTIRSVRLAKS